MSDLFNLFEAIAGGMNGNYDSRKVGKDAVNGLVVSTCYTTDMGYETAILDCNNTYPVERYDSKEDAEEGHKKWIKFCKSKKTKITKLGYGSFIDDEEAILERNEEWAESRK